MSLTSAAHEKAGINITTSVVERGRMVVLTLRRYDTKHREVWLTVATGTGATDSAALREVYREVQRLLRAIEACGKLATQLELEATDDK